MRLASKIALFGLLFATPVYAGEDGIDALLTSGPQSTAILLPDPSHVPIVFGKDIRWTGEAGAHQALLFGDPSKSGIYGVLIKWDPGHYSKPHFHSTDRYIYVVSGTWWVSSSANWDPDKAYPVPAGSYVRDLAGTVHWDGAKDKPCLLMLVGTGPMVTTRLPQTGDGNQ
jgi:quercetin dioxygenase-like cupin family protein